MRKLLACVCVAALTAGSAMAADPCNPCPPQEKWIDVCETVQVEVPVTVYIDEPCEVTITKMVPVEQEVECFVNQWTFETREVCETKKVYECEEYTVQVPKYEMVCETRTKRVPQIVCEEVEKVVKKKVCEEVCDPRTGKMTKIWREECETIMVPVKRKIFVEEEYQVNVKRKIMVPEVRTRKVCRTVPVVKEVRVPKMIQVPSTKKVTVMQPTTETKTVMRKKAVCTTKTVEKQVIRRVKAPVEPCPPEPACPPEPVCPPEPAC